MPKQSNNDKTTNQLKSYARYTGLALQILAAIFLGIWLGMKLDEWLNFTFPLFTLTLSMAALIGSLFYLVKSIQGK